MKKLLLVVDMQNDFITGPLGTPEAQAIVPRVAQKIREWDGDLIYTVDTHGDNYLSTQEGRRLPIVHCVEDSNGWLIEKSVLKAKDEAPKVKNHDAISKSSFGCLQLGFMIHDRWYDYIEFVGVASDICVISNILIIKACCADAVNIAVDASCCAGTTPEAHRSALSVMKSCQVDIINEEVKI